jgi:hypothetical protein
MPTLNVLKDADGRCKARWDKAAQTHCDAYIYSGDVFGCAMINKSDYLSCMFNHEGDEVLQEATK